MTENPAFCRPETKLQEVARLMVDCDFGEIPVVDSDSSRKPIGVITDRDITVRAVAQGRNPLELTARDCMSTDPVTTTPDADLEEAANLLGEHQLRRLPVVNERGELCGIVTQADIAKAAPPQETGDLVREVSQPGGNALHAS
jgi:CBS domain-containing protein